MIALQYHHKAAESRFGQEQNQEQGQERAQKLGQERHPEYDQEHQEP